VATTVSVYGLDDVTLLASDTAPADVDGSFALEHHFDAAGDYLIGVSKPPDTGVSALLRVVCCNEN
jgi:hypothetical protein